MVVRLTAAEDEVPLVEIMDPDPRNVEVPISEIPALVCALLSAKSLTEVN